MYRRVTLHTNMYKKYPSVYSRAEAARLELSLVLSSGEKMAVQNTALAAQRATHGTTEQAWWGPWGAFGQLFSQPIPSLCIAHCRTRAGRAYRGNRWQKSFLIHCTRHFIGNLFIIFFFLFFSKTHRTPTLGSCWHSILWLSFFQLRILHSRLKTSENGNSVHFHLRNGDGKATQST